MNFRKPSVIQAESIPRIINKENVISQAASGSGKTIAFVTSYLDVAKDYNFYRTEARLPSLIQEPLSVIIVFVKGDSYSALG